MLHHATYNDDRRFHNVVTISQSLYKTMSACEYGRFATAAIAGSGYFTVCRRQESRKSG
jgi:hypothetical protein